MWVVHWKVEGMRGHGSPLLLIVAALACDVMNEEHGAGTHWLEEA